tara:strand:- start:7203 stop:8801 length:1599 start_codon:yes stop_codon:yes gene_type:complete
MRTIFTLIILMIWSFDCLKAQNYFTLPKNVWRLSVDNEFSSGQWISANGIRGLPDEFFNLEGYGLQYYDHNNPNTKSDLFNLHEHYVTISDRTDKIIADFQTKSAAIAWGDSLFDFSQNFFGPNAVNMGGYITNANRSFIATLYRIKIDYGISDKVTAAISIPNYIKAEQKNVWGWISGPMDNFDLAGFIAYHKANKIKIENFFASEFSDSLGSYMKNKLNAVYDSFYSVDGQFSILWAMEQNADPIGKSITGSQFNPFTNPEKDPTNIDSLMKFFHPDRTSSGMGDIQLGLNFHLLGSPVWQGESLYSVYGGLGITMPTGRLISIYDPMKVDGLNRPKQFSQLQLGDGIASIKFSLSGEFYRIIKGRRIKVTWLTKFKFNPEAKFSTRISPRGTFYVNADKILDQIGNSYKMRRGNESFGLIDGTLELIPDKIAFFTGQIWYLKGRDTFFSKNSKWNKWMAGGTDSREGYDTRAFAIIQNMGFIYMNTDPMNKFGSIPFEVKLSMQIPLLVQHYWSNLKFNLSFTTFFQFW